MVRAILLFLRKYMEDGGVVVQNLKCVLSVVLVVRFLDAGSHSVGGHC